jgi:hypothetical protein
MASITVNAPLARTCVPGIASVSSATRALPTKRRSAKCGRLLPASRLMGSDGQTVNRQTGSYSVVLVKSGFQQLLVISGRNAAGGNFPFPIAIPRNQTDLPRTLEASVDDKMSGQGGTGWLL